MLLHLDRHSGVPVFRQIQDQVRFLVASGVLKAGAELPSTRALAADLGLNPMTVSKAYAERTKQGPNAFLVYHPDGKELNLLPLLGIELLSNVAAAFVAALVVSRLRAAFPTRVLVVTLMGLFAWLSIEVSYWNWYRFPDAYSLAQAVDQIGGWLLGGIAIGWMVKGKE